MPLLSAKGLAMICASTLPAISTAVSLTTTGWGVFRHLPPERRAFPGGKGHTYTLPLNLPATPLSNASVPRIQSQPIVKRQQMRATKHRVRDSHKPLSLLLPLSDNVTKHHRLPKSGLIPHPNRITRPIQKSPAQMAKIRFTTGGFITLRQFFHRLPPSLFP